MYKTFFTFLLCLLHLGLSAQETTNILFIGNSLTYYNDMPQMVKQIAEDKGHPTQVTMYAPGGTGFIHHVENPTVYNHIREGEWDFVILQPGSSESGGTSQTKEQTLARAKILNDSIAKYNPCAKVLYYEISNGVWGNSQQNISTYNSVMDNIRSNVEFWADHTSSAYVPAGEAMRTAWNNDPNTLLWGSTGDIHPNSRGSYLIACTFYASIFQEASLGNTILANELTSDEASYYQQLADEKVLNHLSDWRINIYHQHADFSYTMNGNSVQFNNQSVNSNTYFWDFGDGTTSTEQNPTHEYNQEGSYQVTLTSYNNQGCEEKVTKQIAYTLAVIDQDLPTVSVYPNPFLDKIMIKGVDIKDVNFYNTLGQVIKVEVSKVKDDLYQIRTEHLSNGVYFLKLNESVYKLIKE